jgi:flagellar biosynthetic protein FliR
MTLIENLLALSLPALVVLVLALARVSGLCMIAPIFGSRMAPVRVRGALVFFLTVAMLPVLPVQAAAAFAADAGPVGLAAGIARELGIGAIIGLAAQFVFGGVQMAGQLAGIQMGIGIANLIDPQTEEHITSLAQWQQLVALLVFLAVDGHHEIIRAVAASFTLLPLGGGLPGAEGVALVLTLASGMFVLALRIAAPVLVLLLLVNGAMGVLAKLIPQLNVFIVGFPLNVAAGIFMLGAAQPFTIRLLAQTFSELGAALVRLLGAMT